MKHPELQGVKKKEVGRFVSSRILPVVSSLGYVQWDSEAIARVQDELLLSIDIERSGRGRCVCLGACIFPLYAANELDSLPGTIGSVSDAIAPGTPAGFEMMTPAETEHSITQIIQVIDEHLVPFLEQVRSSEDLLAIYDAGQQPPVFRKNRNDWHSNFLMGFVAAYVGKRDHVQYYFERSRRALEGCHEEWDERRRREMESFLGILGNDLAVRECLASNARGNRALLKLPFEMDYEKYGIETLE